MKVKELVEQLSWYNPELKVEIYAYGNGEKELVVPVAEVIPKKGIVYLTNQCGVL